VSAVYVETSALLAWLLGEPRAAEAQVALDGAETVVTSELTVLEVERALIRAERGGRLSEGQAQRLRGQFRRLCQGWTRMTLIDDVLDRAARPFPAEPLGTLDALHLATALAFVQVFPDLRVLSFDARVQSNAEALGIA
jgi:predicted nucleic acid-binding protein